MSTKEIICTAVLLLALIFKFWLIAEMEITDDPDDPADYVQQILVASPSYYGPGVALVGQFFKSIDVPFREGIEVLYLLSCLLVVKVLFDWPTRSFLALALFLFVSFNPAPEELFSHILSDQVWLVEAMLGISLFVTFVQTSTRWRCLYLVLAALCLGLSTLTRTTLVPLIVSFVLWALLDATLGWLNRRRNIFDFHPTAGLFVCLAVVGIIDFGTCTYDSNRYGYFGLSMVDSREYRIFYTALQSVGEPDGDKYYPVDDHRLSLIAQAGPVAKKFVDQMRADTRFREVSRETFGQYDFSLGWFHFIVFGNTMPDGNLSQGLMMFKDVEREIAQASAEHRLKVRPVLPLPDCRIPIVLSAFPDALRESTALISKEPSQYAWNEGGAEPKFENSNFTNALSRRAVTPSPLRENLGKALCVFYSVLYYPMLPVLALSVGAYWACLVYVWKKNSALFGHFSIQNLFAIFFVVLLIWYAFFHASGFPAFARYMIYQNVLLPLLVAYYFREAWLMYRESKSLSNQTSCRD
jgi:hypothetical protein